MAARAGMTALIAEMRRMVNEPTTTTYSDDTLQAVIDKFRTTHKRLTVKSADTSSPYLDYPFPLVVGEWVEQSGTNSGWALVDSNDDNAPTYTVNYDAKLITFASDTSNTTYYLSCRAYDLNKTAAVVWREKAAAVAANVDFATDNHAIKASQKAAAYRDMAEYYDALGGSEVFEMYREDML